MPKKSPSLLSAPGSNFGLGRIQPTRQQGLATLGLLADLTPAGDVMAMGSGLANRDALGFGLGAASLLLPGTIKPDIVKSAAKRFGFTEKTTDMPFYDDILNDPDYFKRTKGITAKVDYISPREYLSKLNLDVKDASDIKKFENAILDPGNIDVYANKMLSGDTFPMLTIDMNDAGKVISQEGRTRAMAAIKAGIEEVPVLTVNRIKQ